MYKKKNNKKTQSHWEVNSGKPCVSCTSLCHMRCQPTFISAQSAKCPKPIPLLLFQSHSRSRRSSHMNVNTAEHWFDSWCTPLPPPPPQPPSHTNRKLAPGSNTSALRFNSNVSSYLNCIKIQGPSMCHL